MNERQLKMGTRVNHTYRGYGTVVGYVRARGPQREPDIEVRFDKHSKYEPQFEHVHVKYLHVADARLDPGVGVMNTAPNVVAAAGKAIEDAFPTQFQLGDKVGWCGQGTSEWTGYIIQVDPTIRVQWTEPATGRLYNFLEFSNNLKILERAPLPYGTNSAVRSIEERLQILERYMHNLKSAGVAGT